MAPRRFNLPSFRRLGLLAVAVSVAAFAGAAAGAFARWRLWPQTPGLHAGLMALEVPMDALPVSMHGAAWYPAAPGAPERPTWYSSSAWGQTARNAAPRPQGPQKPLIILAHGWRGTMYDLAWLGEALARQGYVVASVAQADVDAASWNDEQGPKVWYRASVLRALIDAVAHEPRLAGLADVNHVVGIGHSAGGSAVMLLGGAQLDKDRFASMFPQSAPVIDGPWADSRLVGLVALDPGTGPAFAPSGLKAVRVPALIVSGGNDHVAPEPSNAGYYASYVPQAMWRSIAEANHYSFIYECSAYGLLRHFGSCLEAKPSIDRHGVHAQAFAAIEAFLRSVPRWPRAK